MSIFNTNPTKNNPKKMTQQQFSEWLESIDLNYDGGISRRELHAALKQLGVRHTTWRARRAVHAVDRNGNNVVDGKDEKKMLAEYAAKHWGIVVDDS